MKYGLAAVAAILLVSGCASEPSGELYDSHAEWHPPAQAEKKAATEGDGDEPLVELKGFDLQGELGLGRAPSDLGFTERSFNPCRYGISRDCEAQYLGVIHFQLLCRDSEGTISEVPTLTPIVHPQIVWDLAGQKGKTPTDQDGYGQFTVIAHNSLVGHRLILKKGNQFVLVTVNEVNKLVLPKNWCNRI